jgi:hypothetical protein
MSRSSRPFGFEDWLVKNASQYDLILKRCINGNLSLPKAKSRSPFKCLKPECIHYVYGFETVADLDMHIHKQHTFQTQRDPASEKGASTDSRLSKSGEMSRYPSLEPNVSSPAFVDLSVSTGDFLTTRGEYAAATISGQTSSRSNQPYAFITEFPSLSEETEWSTVSRPLKRGLRTGPLGKDAKKFTKEMRSIRACLRCRFSKRKV